MIWYIAGPMTGIEDWNYPAFHEAERWLREHFPGDEIINPATGFDGDTTLPREHYMRAALVNVAKCDRVYLLDGWRQSRGACMEVIAARECGAEICHEYCLSPCSLYGEDYRKATKRLAKLAKR